MAEALAVAESHLSDLNPEQLMAVRHGGGPLLVFAGAGSGKTRVLTRRIVNLIVEHGVAPGSIFAVTFTNKAAAEMKRRVGDMLGGAERPLWVSTFHSSCARILRQHAKLLDFTPNFAIYDTADSHSVLKRAYAKLNIDPRVIEIRQVAARIDRAKNEYKFPEQVRIDRYTPGTIAEMVADLYQEYQRELQASNAMDFGDLLCHVITLLKLEPKVLENYQEQFSHLLVDEYQDTNCVQYMLIKMLAGTKRNLCVVGDDDQSIYAFRGATVENILNFKRDFSDAAVVTLDRNYRSTKNILRAANQIIARNQKRQEKKMRTENGAGHSIVCYEGIDERDEGAFIAREISLLMRNGTKPRDIAVFYRTNAQSRAIEEEFCESSLPYEIYGGHKFYDRKEIKDVLAYFRLLLNQKDNEAFLRIVNTPVRGLGPTAVAGLVAYAAERRLSLREALTGGISEDAKFLTPSNKRRFVMFHELLEEFTGDLRHAEEILEGRVSGLLASERMNALAVFLQKIAERTGYLKQLKAEDTPEAQSRIENLFELFAVAAEFVKKSFDQGESVQLSDFLERTSLSSDLEKENRKFSSRAERIAASGAVSLMTLHLAKGLEFDVVFLTGLEEGLLPHVRSLDDRRALEEERRLCYVGITRARKRLFITRATSRQSFGRMNWYTGARSRFLDDLPDELVEDRSVGFRDRRR